MAAGRPPQDWQTYILGISAIASVGFAAWLATAVIDLKAELAAMKSDLRNIERRIGTWEVHP